MHDDITTTRSQPAAGGGQKILGTAQPMFGRQHDETRWLRREFGAALGAATGEDGAARAGTHPEPETMRLCTTAVIGLEGALHGLAPARILGKSISPLSLRRKAVIGQTGLASTTLSRLPLVGDHRE
jgi:hypothetical protein